MKTLRMDPLAVVLDSFICILLHSDHKHPQNKIYEMKYSLDFLCEINSIVDTMGFHSRAIPFKLIGKNRSSVNFIQPTQERHHHKQIFHKKRVACAGNNSLQYSSSCSWTKINAKWSMHQFYPIMSNIELRLIPRMHAPPRPVVQGKGLPHPAKGGFALPRPTLW